MDQKAREAVEKVDSCCNGCELFRIAKQRVGEKKGVGDSCLKDESGAVKVWMMKENQEGAHGKFDECWKYASKLEGAVRRIEIEEVW